MGCVKPVDKKTIGSILINSLILDLVNEVILSTRWKQEEDEYLLANYESHNIQFLSKVLARSESAIRSRYKRLADADEEINRELDYFLSRAGRITPKRLKRYKTVIENTSKAVYKRGSAYAHTKTGYRPDLDLVVRSGWEANVLRVLKSYNINYEFEPKKFVYPVKRGNKSYIPDIYLSDTDEWIEIKGYLDKNSQVKLKRFKRYYPEEFEKLTMIIGASNKTRAFCKDLEVPIVIEYPRISKTFKDKIKNWEGR